MYLEHANITVRNLEQTLKFLQTAFPDFHIRGSGSLSDQAGRWLHFGNDKFYIALQENDEHLSNPNTRYYADGINHMGFVVDNLDEIKTRLSAKGFKEKPAPPHPFRQRSYYFDNNGVEWEFVQYLSDDPKKRNSYE